MKKLFFVLVVGLLLNTHTFAKEENEYYVDYLKACSAQDIETFSLKDDEVTVFKSKKLDLNCLEKQFLTHLKSFPVESYSSSNMVPFDETIIRDNKKINDGLVYDSIKISSLYSQKCGENCVFSDEAILIQGDDYLYIRGFGDRGVEAELVNQDIVLIKNLMSTHVRNYLFNQKDKKYTLMPNGVLEFNKDYILVKQQKSYFNERGAFWFSSKRNYQGEIIELISDGSTCKPAKSFHETIQAAMEKQNLKEFCVSR